MSKNNVPALKPHVRQTPGLESWSDQPSAIIPFNRIDGHSVDDLVDMIIKTIPAEMLAVAVKALAERTRKRLTIKEIRQRLEDDAAELLNGRAERLIDSLHSEFDEELRARALSMADEDAELAIEDGDLDDFIADLADSTIQEELLN
jgi:hypothetical protein